MEHGLPRKNIAKQPKSVLLDIYKLKKKKRQILEKDDGGFLNNIMLLAQFLDPVQFSDPEHIY